MRPMVAHLAFMLVFADTRCNAVIVTDVNIDCQVVCANEWGVCGCLEGVFGRVCMVNFNCYFASGTISMVPGFVLLLASNTTGIRHSDATDAVHDIVQPHVQGNLT